MENFGYPDRCLQGKHKITYLWHKAKLFVNSTRWEYSGKLCSVKIGATRTCGDNALTFTVTIFNILFGEYLSIVEYTGLLYPTILPQVSRIQC